MKNAFVVAAMGLMLAIGTQAQAKPDVKPPVVPAAAPATPAPEKPIPSEIITAFNEWNALNQAVAKIKHEEGIDKLESQLETKRMEVLDLAAKEHYHWDQAKATFLPDATPAPAATPTPAPAATVTPAPTKTVPAKK